MGSSLIFKLLGKSSSDPDSTGSLNLWFSNGLESTSTNKYFDETQIVKVENANQKSNIDPILKLLLNNVATMSSDRTTK